jgi:hypothetical protein
MGPHCDRPRSGFRCATTLCSPCPPGLIIPRSAACLEVWVSQVGGGGVGGGGGCRSTTAWMPTRASAQRDKVAAGHRWAEEAARFVISTGACMPGRASTRPAPHTTHTNNGQRMYAGEGNHHTPPLQETPTRSASLYTYGRRMHTGDGNHTPAPPRTCEGSRNSC